MSYHDEIGAMLAEARELRAEMEGLYGPTPDLSDLTPDEFTNAVELAREIEAETGQPMDVRQAASLLTEAGAALAEEAEEQANLEIKEQAARVETDITRFEQRRGSELTDEQKAALVVRFAEAERRGKVFDPEHSFEEWNLENGRNAEGHYESQDSRENAMLKRMAQQQEEAKRNPEPAKPTADRAVTLAEAEDRMLAQLPDPKEYEPYEKPYQADLGIPQKEDTNE